MSRMARIKEMIDKKESEFRAKIEESHKAGRVPSEYSLGMVNSLIFCNHHINMKNGNPKFYDKTMAIGSLPKPVVLQTDKFKNMQGADEIYESLRDKVMLEARNDPDPSLSLKEAVKAMDGFIEQIEQAQQEVAEDGKTEEAASG